MLDKDALKSAIYDAFNDQREKTQEPEAALNDLSEKLATALDNFIKGASIYATTAQVTSAALSNSAGPVSSANNLESTIE